MRNTALVALASALLLSCASSTSSPDDGTRSNAAIPEPEITFVQLVGPDELNWPEGEIELQYGMRIENRADHAITLKHVQMDPMGTEGAYTVYRRRYTVPKAIGPNGIEEVTFWAKAYSNGRRLGLSARSPITVRTTAFFDSPEGPFRKVVVTNLSQATTH
jgi:hypothetical protein